MDFKMDLRDGHHRLVYAYDHGRPLPARRIDPDLPEERTRVAYLDPKKVFHDPQFHKNDTVAYAGTWYDASDPAETQSAFEQSAPRFLRMDNEEGDTGSGAEAFQPEGWEDQGPPLPADGGEPVRRAVDVTGRWGYSTLSDWEWEGPLPPDTVPLSDLQFSQYRS